jgi:iron complex transport system ATP-binding protein
MTLLSLENLSVSLGGRTIVEDVSITVGTGEVVGLIGPNGAGKTTLLRAAQGLVPFKGTSSLAALGPKARARHAAFLPQEREIAWPVEVARLVLLGRLPHGEGGPEDILARDAAITALGLEALRHRAATELSGGEKARVLLARVVAQSTPLVLADEPCASLDPAHQIAVMRVFAQMANTGHGVLATLHDLSLAARHCTRLILMNDGRVAAEGEPRNVLTEARLAQVFGIRGTFEESVEGPILKVFDTI